MKLFLDLTAAPKAGQVLVYDASRQAWTPADKSAITLSTEKRIDALEADLSAWEQAMEAKIAKLNEQMNAVAKAIAG